MVYLFLRFYIFVTYVPKESSVLDRMHRLSKQDSFVSSMKACAREEMCIGSGHSWVMIWSAHFP